MLFSEFGLLFIILSIFVGTIIIVHHYRNKRRLRENDQQNKYLSDFHTSEQVTTLKKEIGSVSYVSKDGKKLNSLDELASEKSKRIQLWKMEKIESLSDHDFVDEILLEKEIKNIGYPDLLNLYEWQFKRLKILVRDNFKCQICGSISESNHVHHKYYLKDKLPWDIDDNVLVTLCNSCHTNVHKQSMIKVFENRNGILREAYNLGSFCRRCFGTGYLPQYTHVQNGICFECWGDCVNRTVFSNALKGIKNELSTYNNKEIKDSCIKFINSIDTTLFLTQLESGANTNNIIRNGEESLMDGNDDLPF